MRIRDLVTHSRLALSGSCLLAVALLATSADGAVKVRGYQGGEDDAGATLGGLIPDTTDFILPPTMDAGGNPVADNQGDFVTLNTDLATGTSPVYVEGRDGAGSLAYGFDGTPAYMASGAFDPRNFSTFASMSQAWVKPNSSGDGRQQYIWSLGNDNGGVGIGIDDDGNARWQLIASSIVQDTLAPDSNDGIEFVNFDEWTHLAVFRGGNDARLFVNGRLQLRIGGFWNGVGEVTLGTRTNARETDEFFDGAVDDFNIAGFSDFALSVVDDVDFFDDFITSGVRGDVDQDGDADQQDYNIWSSNVGFDNGQNGGDPTTLILGDLDSNGRINFFDLNEIVQGAQEQGNPIVFGAIPEPTTAAVLLVIGSCLAGIRRRR